MTYQRAKSANIKQPKYKKGIFLIILLFLPLLLSGFLIFQNISNRREITVLKQKSTLSAAKLDSNLVAKVGRLTVLPKEEPTIATVKDINQLTNEVFFKEAKNGDRVLIYPKSKKAIIYRPSTDKVIQTGPINFNQDQAAN